MEAHADTSTPLVLKSCTLVYHLTTSFPSFKRTEKLLSNLLANHISSMKDETLKKKYKTMQDLCDTSLAVKGSRSSKLLAVITRDFYLIVFDLNQELVYAMEVPLLSRMHISSLALSGRKAVVCGLHQLLFVDWRSQLISGIDFSAPAAVKPFLCPRSENSRLAKALSKGVTVVNKGYYSGSFIASETNSKLIVKGVIGVIYTKQQVEKDTESISAAIRSSVEDTEDTNHTLVLTKICYEEGQRSLLRQKGIGIKYADGQGTLLSVVVKTDSRCAVTLVALNSSEKLFTRILIVNADVTAYTQVTPINFIEENVILAGTRRKRTSVCVSDMAWIHGDSCAVVLFSMNYFCIISVLGEPLKILCKGKARYCVELPLVAYCNSLRVTDKRICAFGKSKCAIAEYKVRIPPSELWKLKEDQEKADSLFQLVLLFPKLSVNKPLLNELHDMFQQNYILGSASTSECRTSTATLAENVARFVEKISWATEHPSIALDIMHKELESAIDVLCAKKRIILVIRVLKEYNKQINTYLKKAVTKNVHYYGVKGVKELVEQSRSVLATIEQRKALLMFYYQALFRECRGSYESIQFLVKAEKCRENWGEQNIMSKFIATVSSIVKFSLVPFKQFAIKESSEGKSEVRFENESALRQAIMSLLDEVSLKNIDSNFLKKMECRESVVYSLASLYIEEELDKVIAVYNKSLSIREFLRGVESPARYLYCCAELLKDKKHNALFTMMGQAFKHEIRKSRKSEEVTFFLMIFSASFALALISLVKRNFTINFSEVLAFLCKFLLKEDLIAAFEQLKVPANEAVPLTWPNAKELPYFVAGISLQLGESKLAIELCVESYDSNGAALGILMLNNALNAAVIEDSEEGLEEWTVFAITQIKRLANSYLKDVVSKANSELRTSSVFSVCIDSSSEITGAVILHTVLPLLLTRLNWLLQAEDVNVALAFKPSAQSTGIKPYSSIANIERTFCQSKTYQLFLSKYFPTEIKCSVFDSLLREAMDMFGSSLNAKIIDFSHDSAFDDNFFKVSKLVPKDVAENIKKMVMELVRFMWKFTLLLMNEDRADTGPRNQLRLAGLIVRLSYIANSEQQKLEFLQKGINLLKYIPYDKIAFSKETIEEVTSLGNALGLYPGKWESLLKADLQEVFESMKKGNHSLYEMLNKTMPKRKFSIQFQECNNGKLGLDTVFHKLLCLLKDILSRDVEAKEGESLRKTLREFQGKAEVFTGIPEGKMIGKDYHEWSLKPVNLFKEENDYFAGQSVPIAALNKLLELAPCKPTDKKKQNRASILETWRLASKSQTNRGQSLEYKSQIVLERNFAFEAVAARGVSKAKFRTMEPVEDTLRAEVATSSVINLFTATLRSTLKAMREAFPNSAARDSLGRLDRSGDSNAVLRHPAVLTRSLVESSSPLSKSSCSLKFRSPTLANHVVVTEAPVKPFTIYPIKRSQIAQPASSPSGSPSFGRHNFFNPAILTEPSDYPSPSVSLSPNL